MNEVKIIDFAESILFINLSSFIIDFFNDIVAKSALHYLHLLVIDCFHFFFSLLTR